MNEEFADHDQEAHNEQIIQTLTTKKVTVESKNLCAICLKTYRVGETLFQLECSHHFHTDCIEPWLKRQTQCPTCRRQLQPASKKVQKTNSDYYWKIIQFISHHFFLATDHPSSISSCDSSITTVLGTSATMATSGIFSSLVFLALGFLFGYVVSGFTTVFSFWIGIALTDSTLVYSIGSLVLCC